MSRDIKRHVLFDPETGRPLPAETDFATIAAALVESARGQAVELTGPNGLLTGLTRQVLQQALEVEMADHLGYDKREFEGRNGLNSRNGSTPKTVRTEIGEVTVQIRRDQQATFEPAITPKYQRRTAGFDEAVISLYAKGMTTGDIQAHLADVYGQEISRDLVSKVTDAVLVEMQAWEERRPGEREPGGPEPDRCRGLNTALDRDEPVTLTGTTGVGSQAQSGPTPVTPATPSTTSAPAATPSATSQATRVVRAAMTPTTPAPNSPAVALPSAVTGQTAAQQTCTRGNNL